MTIRKTLRVWLSRFAPRGLYVRSLLIVIMPMVILQAVLTYAFMDRHWQTVTKRLSTNLAQTLSMLIELRENPQFRLSDEALVKLAQEKYALSLSFQPLAPLPPQKPAGLFSPIHASLARELPLRVQKPFWFDGDETDESFLRILIQLDDRMMQVQARYSQAGPSNAHIFLVWMALAAFILITVAILFMRNQIRPILSLARAAEAFGKGREIRDFKIHGAREVRTAARAFVEMRRRIERQMEQRTTMLAGVSHDLKTMLTRFSLSLALLKPSPDVEALRRDADEMARMVEAYLAFARGEGDEPPTLSDVRALLAQLIEEAGGADILLESAVDQEVFLRVDAFRRMMMNVLQNAVRYGERVEVKAEIEGRWLVVSVDDNGPGIPEEQRDEAFKPFVRLDEARNQDNSGTGLGLSIARDVARMHGGEISLYQSTLGGLRVVVRLPL